MMDKIIKMLTVAVMIKDEIRNIKFINYVYPWLNEKSDLKEKRE